MNYIRKKIDYILKHNTIIQIIYKFTFSNLFKLIGIFIKTDDSLILFSGHGRNFNDSPRVIYEYIVNNDLYQNYKMCWALENPDEVNISHCNKVKVDTFKYFITALKAKYWVTCVNIERGLKFKKKNTRFLNTWHGVAINKMGNAVNKRKDFDCSNVDIFCYSGEFEKSIIVRDFNTRESSMFPSGLPRNDELYNLNIKKINDLKKVMNIPINKKVILYAPTWRDSTDSGKTYELVPPIDWDKWENELGDQFVILLRTHAYTTKLMNVKFNNFIIDASNYSKVNDLLLLSDILISDYSSIIFDYAILERPIFCFGYDYMEYNEYRGFYIDLEKELPSGVLTDESDLLYRIKIINYKEECLKTKMLKNKYINYGGNATEMCVKKLLNI